MSNSNDKPIQIAYIDNNRLYIKTNKINKILDKAGQCPVSITSINGPMRSGKSYLINQILKYLYNYPSRDWFKCELREKFEFKNSSERQTTGIWMWSKPFMVKKNGQDIAVLLMDTQGSFDQNTTEQENVLIFTLSFLLSSTLIYNVKNQLSEDVFQFLQMFIGYANIRENADADSKLVLILRDWQSPKSFSYGYYDDHVSTGPKNFMKKKVMPNATDCEDVVDRRNEILNSFKEVACSLFPYPGNSLALNDDEDELDHEFETVMKDFIKRVMGHDKIVAKRLGGTEINSMELKQYIENLADYFKNNVLPKVRSINDLAAETHNQLAYSKALEFYKNEMKIIIKKDDLTEIILSNSNKTNSEKALNMFNAEKRLKNNKLQNKYSEKLKIEIEKEFENYEKINKSNFERKSMKEKIERQEKELNEAKEIAKAAEEEKIKDTNDKEIISKKNKESLEERLTQVEETIDRDKRIENLRKVVEGVGLIAHTVKYIVDQSESKLSSNDSKPSSAISRIYASSSPSPYPIAFHSDNSNRYFSSVHSPPRNDSDSDSDSEVIFPREISNRYTSSVCSPPRSAFSTEISSTSPCPPPYGSSSTIIRRNPSSIDIAPTVSFLSEISSKYPSSVTSPPPYPSSFGSLLGSAFTSGISSRDPSSFTSQPNHPSSGGSLLDSIITSENSSRNPNSASSPP